MTKTTISLGLVFLLLAAATVFLVVNRPRKVIIDAPLPIGFPVESFAHDSFEQLLQTYVSADGRTDYERWHSFSASREQLDSYLAAVAQFSPHNSPERFPNRNDELAYWMYAYNAYVIKSVLDHWPIASVTDVKAPLEAVTGLGFFYRQRFAFGGKYMSLLKVETTEIRENFKDPRIHFFLNCASESCPIARPELPVGEDLETLLAEATVDFINDATNVSVDHEEETVYLSTIFKWYENDFTHALRIDGKPAEHGLLAYVSQYAASSLTADIAQAGDYEIEFRDYDWDINSSH